MMKWDGNPLPKPNKPKAPIVMNEFGFRVKCDNCKKKFRELYLKDGKALCKYCYDLT